MIDTHVHLNLPDYSDIPGVLARAKAQGVTRCIVPGLDSESSRRAIMLAEQYPEISAAVGLHPLSEDEPKDDFVALASSPYVKAIGEIGTDRKGGEWFAQEKRLRYFLELALKMKKPALIHIRDTWDKTFLILQEYPELAGRAVVHCFTGTQKEADMCQQLGLLVSVTAILARESLHEVREVIREWPLDKLMLETDGPYLAWPGEPWPNEPATVVKIAQLIADIKDISVEEVQRVTTYTAEKFFSL